LNIDDIFKPSKDVSSSEIPYVSSDTLSLDSKPEFKITLSDNNHLSQILNTKSYLQQENESLKEQIDQLENSCVAYRNQLNEKENKIEKLQKRIKKINQKYNPKIRRLTRNDCHFPFNDYGQTWVE